jgi:hypothetical protein
MPADPDFGEVNVLYLKFRQVGSRFSALPQPSFSRDVQNDASNRE